VEAKNKLENYAYSVRNAMNDETLTDKLSANDKSELSQAVDATLKWFEANNGASKEEFEYKMTELERKVNPIMTRVHSGVQNSAGPKIEEELD
jgi:heat shock 70kDa protein 1/2/6/8